MTDLEALEKAPRLLIEATLTPVQTDRFQPTGFPDLGAATYTVSDGEKTTDMLLVESAQSMANRAEAACWDEAENKLVPALAGLPYVHVDISDGTSVFATTSSVLEAHRLNSPFVLDGKLGSRSFKEILLEKAELKEGQPVDARKRFLLAAFHHDPASLLHGLFMSQVDDGRLRFARAMSSFIEARGVRVAQSGGVKNDRINPSGEAAKGFGNVPFARTEYTAEKTTAFMNLDLRQLRSFGLPANAVTLLELLAIYKFQKLLRDQLRLRTACDFEAKEVRVTAPEGFALPSIEALEKALPVAVAACMGLVADPPVTRLVFASTESSAKVSKKAAKAKAEAGKSGIRFEIRFPSGRFHATPWGHHVNEGVPEWPPSPWRIARALAAAMYTRCPELDRTVALAALRVLATPPAFTLPPATASHTRHYLSQNKPDRAGRMVFDAFVAVDRGQSIVVHWPAVPSPAERRALTAMASEVSYLGRAEAWCELRVMGEGEEAPAPSCEPSDGRAAESMTTERVLCPAEGFSEQDLGRTTSELHKEGWSDPPGTRWVFYRRPSHALSPRGRSSAPAPEASRPTVAELALGGTVLPLFTDAVRVAEQIRAAAMSCLGTPPSPVLSGKDEGHAARRDQHRHAHFVPEARGKTNRITHVVVYAPEGLGRAEQRALAALRFLKQEHGRPTLDVVLAGFGDAGDFREASALFGVSRSWRSKTPFVLPRHPKRGKDAPEAQVARELELRGFPVPVSVERSDGVALWDPGAGEAAKTRWLSFRMQRQRDRGRQGGTAGFGGFVVEFAEAQRGPILLGYGAHYGLGQFEAE